MDPANDNNQPRGEALSDQTKENEWYVGNDTMVPTRTCPAWFKQGPTSPDVTLAKFTMTSI